MFTDTYSRAAPPAALLFSPAKVPIAPVSPAPNLGLKPRGPNPSRAAEPQGYISGQFGKNHLGNRDEHLPTVHSFDEFFGNLYHLNAEEEQNSRLSQGCNFKQKFGPARCAPRVGAAQRLSTRIPGR